MEILDIVQVFSFGEVEPFLKVLLRGIIEADVESNGGSENTVNFCSKESIFFALLEFGSEAIHQGIHFN